MKSLVIYSTLTGNTKTVAEAIAEVLPECDIFPVQEAPDSTEGYDLVAVGYWVDKGMPDAKTRKWLEKTENTVLAFFGTLGAYPDSDHAKECMAKGEALALADGKNNTVLGSWLCQGKVDPKLLEMMAKMNDGIHPMTEERKARIEEAKKHPNREDCKNAQAFMLSVVKKIEGRQ